MKIKNIIYLLFLFLILNISSLAYINISPTTLDKNIGVGAYEEFTLFNNTSIPLRYKIEAIAMENKDGSIGNMSEWAEIYPKVVTVYPAEQKKFKVYIKAPKGSKTGDYGTFLNIRQISAPKLKGEVEDAVGAGMVVMTNLNMGVYGYIGDKEPKIELTTPKIINKNDGKYLQAEIVNKTNRLVRMKVEVVAGRNLYYPVGEIRAMAGKTLIVDNIIQRIPKEEKVKELIITDTETKKIIKKLKLN